jgi:hypothetical protein
MGTFINRNYPFIHLSIKGLFAVGRVQTRRFRMNNEYDVVSSAACI